jgi:hypothetical protein
MMTKKNVLLVSIAYITYVVGLLLISGTCNDNWCRIQEDGPFGLILFSLAPLLFIFLLSLLTYRMKDEVFLAWFNFAKWWVPVIIGVTLWVENAGGGGGWGMNGGAFDAFFIGIFYFIFIVVSLVKITRAYMRTREKK